MPAAVTNSYLTDSLSLFRYYKKLGEGAISQVSDDELAAALDEEMNSVSLIVKHMTGNMRSRWTNFLTSDGEKPDRNRDTELLPGFEVTPDHSPSSYSRACGSSFSGWLTWNGPLMASTALLFIRQAWNKAKQ